MSEPRRDRAAARPGERSETEGLSCHSFDKSFCLSIPHRLRRRSRCGSEKNPSVWPFRPASSPGRGAKRLAVLLRGWLLFCSFRFSQILRHFVPQDDTPCSFPKTANRVILRRACPTKNLSFCGAFCFFAAAAPHRSFVTSFLRMTRLAGFRNLLKLSF